MPSSLDAADAAKVRESAVARGLTAWVMGEVVSGSGKVILNAGA
jgi:hypothetical protein